MPTPLISRLSGLQALGCGVIGVGCRSFLITLVHTGSQQQSVFSFL